MSKSQSAAQVVTAAREKLTAERQAEREEAERAAIAGYLRELARRFDIELGAGPGEWHPGDALDMVIEDMRKYGVGID